MLYDPRVEESLRHIDSASAVLRASEPAGTADADQVPDDARAAALEHLQAAERALADHRGPEGVASPRLQSKERLELVDRILSLLPFLVNQMTDTTYELSPLRPTGGRDPLRRLDDIDVEAALVELRRLRRQASDLEAAFRRLHRRRETAGVPSN
jgi:hypothetical protein